MLSLFCAALSSFSNIFFFGFWSNADPSQTARMDKSIHFFIFVLNHPLYEIRLFLEKQVVAQIGIESGSSIFMTETQPTELLTTLKDMINVTLTVDS